LGAWPDIIMPDRGPLPRLRAGRPRSDRAERPAATIAIHSLTHAVAALRAAVEAGRPITLLSAADAGIYAGAGWFAALVAAAREAVPLAQSMAWLDCGDDAGAAMAAIRAAVEGVIFTGRADVAARLADLATQAGIRLETTRPEPLVDLATAFFQSAGGFQQLCADVLASAPAFC